MYPHIYKLLKELAVCNDLLMKERIVWPKEYRMFHINKESKFVIENNLVQKFLDNGEDEVYELASKHGLFYLDEFLDEAFDGKYHDNFFKLESGLNMAFIATGF